MEVAQNVFHTGFMREQNAFAAAAARFRDTGRKVSRVLSFGCSVGDEIATLRCYFPDAHIVACDVNPAVVAVSRKFAIEDRRVEVIQSHAPDILARKPFDFIVASAVLCRNPSPANYAKAFSFDLFESMVSLLDESLVEDGVLLILNAGYRFSDTAVARHYDTLRCDLIWSNGFVDVFNPDGSPFLMQTISYGQPFYLRLGDWSLRDNENIADALFEKRAGAGGEILWLAMQPPPSTEPTVTYVRRNIDYLPDRPPSTALIVEHQMAFHRDELGTILGHSRWTSWSSFSGNQMYNRPWPVWIPLAVT